MSIYPKLSVAAMTLAAATAFTTTALAGGEPKNEPPFTRVVGVRSTAAPAAHELRARIAPGSSAGSSLSGESKSDLPFTRRIR
jgi:hypothetical protein